MKQIFCMAVIAMMLCSCNNKEKKEAITQDESLNRAEEKSAYKTDSSVYSSGLTNNQEQTKKEESAKVEAPHQDWDKKIIKTADIKLAVKDYNKYNNAIHAGVKNFGAYIAKEEQTQSGSGFQNTITIKVPVDKFEDLVNTMNGEGISIIEKK